MTIDPKMPACCVQAVPRAEGLDWICSKKNKKNCFWILGFPFIIRICFFLVYFVYMCMSLGSWGFQIRLFGLVSS